ncbi:phosphotransferase [Bradyrhizobium sp. CCBAU 11357]|uniref:phosphotransferase n=1 Tax=Bradyrhizobium sp. CCBAU 11357 TaxID=1630808 RepID=UPI00230265CD|nr:phosphotransferase [Bradyrhizobium sp. CCBAU 11357]
MGSAHDPRGLRSRRPGAGGARRGRTRGTLRHRAAAPQRTDPAGAGAHLPARPDGRRLESLRRRCSEAHRHRYPRPDRPPRPGDELCHCDLHTDNVIMTADGPRLIDWTLAVRAPAAYDLACCHVSLSEIAPERVDNPQRPRAINAAAQSEYARLAGTSQATLTAAMEPYLPIARARILLGGVFPALREWLIQRIEVAVPPEV